MALIETISITLGTSIIKSILGVWLKDNPVAVDASKSILDILKTKTENHFAIKKGVREFEEISDKVSITLIPLYESYSQIKEKTRELIAVQASDAIRTANINFDLLVEFNYNPEKLYKHILKQSTKIQRDLSGDELSLFNRTLDLASQYIIDINAKLPDFNKRSFTEILNRFDELSKPVYQILDKLNNISDEIQKRNSESIYSDFEKDYRMYIIRKYDKLTLFGADVNKCKRYSLSVAYVSLDVCEDDEYGESRLSVAEAFKDANKTMILGEAGCGKSTLLQWLAINIADKNIQNHLPNFKNTIPFLVQLRRFNNDPPVPKDFIKHTAREISNKEPENWINKVMESGRAVLLIDGLDEVPKNKRNNIVEWIENIQHSYNLRIIITSRPGAKEWRDITDNLGFAKYFISPMSMTCIEKFVKYWHYSVIRENDVQNEELTDIIISKDRASKELITLLISKLLFKLRNNEPLMKLSKNPLLCAMICALHYEKNMQLPSEKVTLYEACCSMLLESRDKERDITNDAFSKLSLRQKYKILENLAYWMMKNGDSYITMPKANIRVDSLIQNMGNSISVLSTQEILSGFIERSGIVREPSYGNIDFIHRTFQEYMAARAIRDEDDWGLLLKYSNDDQWQETIILSAGFTNQNQADKLITGLLAKSQNNEMGYYFDLLAMSCLETAVMISPEVREKVKLRIKSLIPPQNNTLRKALASTRELAVPFLKYKDGYNEIECISCIKTLGQIGTMGALNQISKYLRSSKFDNVTDCIIDLLKRFTPREISNSKLGIELLRFIFDSIRNNSLTLSGNVLIATSSESDKKVTKFTENIKKLDIYDCTDTVLSYLYKFPFVEHIIINGDFTELNELSSLKSLTMIEIISKDQHWPNLKSLCNIPTLCKLKIISNTGSWPFINQLQDSSRLTDIYLVSTMDDNEIDYYVFEQISYIQSIRRLHISYSGYIDFNVSPLSNLKALEEIEISTFSKFLPENIITLCDLHNLNKIIINVERRNHFVKQFVSELSICLPKCSIEVNINPLNVKD